ncbi:site-specific tyrosine recombinase XerC [Stieleria neptunia]|uniref:Site-specific tyrosine recombinase XerC n=1 Tax=Stieleria neptunia TaxID=2527979 RepID=A0A518HSZ1_9BACT|nr:tyrosine-type recombinase/integrase [Stieleria neptunia]QDV43957.1 site-specific tyrosine recombinase XerC [Stieleria neptunia]
MARRPKPWYWKSRKAWYVTIDGTRHKIGSTKTEADKNFKLLMQQPKKKRVAIHRPLAEIIDSFLEWNSKHRSEATYEWYRYRLQRFIDCYPDLSLEELRPYHVQQWVDSYPDFKCTTQRNYVRSIKRCTKWAMKQGYTDSDPLVHLDVPGSDRKELVLTDEQYQMLLDNCTTESFRDLLVVTRETGCRPQESLRLEARHVDLEYSRWVFPKEESKGKKTQRVVYLTEKALEITKRLILTYPEGKLFRNSRGDAWTSDSANCAIDRIRVRHGKAEMKREGISIPEKEIKLFIPSLKPTKTVKGLVREKTNAELRCEAKQKLTLRYISKNYPRFSLYCLRHTFATAALKKIDSMTVSILLGHKDPSMLGRVYQHLGQNPAHLAEQLRRAVG